MEGLVVLAIGIALYFLPTIVGRSAALSDPRPMATTR